MIQAQELRIGNFVLSLNGQLVKVSGITQRALTVEDDRNYVSREAPLNYFKPVWLTESVLEKTGFVPASRHDADNIFTHHKLATHLYLQQNENDGYSMCLSDDSGQFVEVLRTINSLHELQNCFYIFTGSELDAHFETVV